MADIKIPGNVKLRLLDRIMLLEVLPKEGDSLTLKIVRKLRETLSFTEEELREYEMRQEGGQIMWNDKGAAYEKDVHMGREAFNIVCETLMKRKEKGDFSEEHMDVYRRFLGLTPE